MILSHDRYIPLKSGLRHGPCKFCSATHSPRFFYDVASATIRCAEHTSLEHLDPDSPLNAKVLRDAHVSRLSAYPTLQSVTDILVPDAARPGWYVRTDVQANVRVGVVYRMLEELTVYHPLEPSNYFFDVTRRDFEGEDYAKLSLVTQLTMVRLPLGVVPWEDFEDFLKKVRKSQRVKPA